MLSSSGIKLPTSAWMHKPRSKLKDEGIGASVFGLRGFNANTWNKRYVFVEGNFVCYGPSLGQKEKTIPLETVKAANYVSRELLKGEKAPEALLDFGWSMLIDGKDIMFVCESEAVRNEWVYFLQAVLQSMGNAATSSLASAGGAHNTHSASGVSMNRMSESGGGGEAAHTTSALVARAMERERERATQLGDEGEDENGHEIQSKSQAELKKFSCADADDDLQLDLSQDKLDEDDDDLSDFELDDEELDDDDDGGEGKKQHNNNNNRQGAASSREKKQNGNASESRENLYQRFLLPKSEQRYNHIAYKLEGYKEHFKSGDSIANVVFSRSLHKVAKRDNNQDRDLVVTHNYVYLFAKGSLLTRTNVRAIQIDQLIGVIESTVEADLLALIVPSFHDVLLRITPQNSMIGGSEVEVKHQLIAHLYAAHRRIVQGRQFIFRESDNIRQVIRRCETDQHLPLVTKPNDKLLVGTNKELFPVLRTNADSIVYWSSMVVQINVKRESNVRAFVVTDSAFYLVDSSLTKILRRTAISEVKRILFDVDTRGILIKCTEVDTMLNVKQPADFQQIQATMIEVASEAGNTVKAYPSKQLFSSCQLVEPRRLMEEFGTNTEESLRKGMKLTQRLLKRSWQGTRQLTNQIVNVGGKSVDLLKIAGKEMGNLVLDNALTGEMLGLIGSATGRFLLTEHRFLQEVIIEPSDEERLLALETPYPDTLKLSQQENETKLGPVVYSSRCSKFNLVAHLDADRTEERILAINANGVHLYYAPDSGFSISSSLRGLFTFGSGWKLDETIAWSNLSGLVQCEKESSVVALLAGGDKHLDIMLRIPNDTLAWKFVSAASLMYTRSTNSKKYARDMLPVYSVPRIENLRIALKKTIFDPAPTIALRIPPQSNSDAEMLAFVPDIADLCRRYGDNTIFFSGLAWRFRSNTTKQGGDKMEEVLKDDDKKSNKTLFKSFVLVLTNCAVYQCTKGGYEVARRTNVRAIKEVYVSKEDPDALLLIIPEEYDLFFRVDGRGREFLERLQEAATEWTNYGLYLPGEAPNSHLIADYSVKVSAAENLAATGRLEKPATFNEEQAKTTAVEIEAELKAWLTKDLEDAKEQYAETIDAASQGLLVRHLKNPESVSESQLKPSWNDVCEELESAVARLSFSVERAFRSGLRAKKHTTMREVSRLIYEWRDMLSISDDLIRAIDEQELTLYDERHTDAENYPALRTLIEEQAAIYTELRQKKEIVDRIKSILLDTATAVTEREADITQAFKEARAVRLKQSTEDELRRQLNERLQCERLTSHIRQLIDKRSATTFPPSLKATLVDAARRVKVQEALLHEFCGVPFIQSATPANGTFSSANSIASSPSPPTGSHNNRSLASAVHRATVFRVTSPSPQQRADVAGASGIHQQHSHHHHHSSSNNAASMDDSTSSSRMASYGNTGADAQYRSMNAAIDSAIAVADVKVLQDAIGSVGTLAGIPGSLSAKLTLAKEQAALLNKHAETLRELAAARTHAKTKPPSSVTADDIDRSAKQYEATLKSLPDAPIFASARQVGALHLSRLAKQAHYIRQQQLRDKKEAQAMKAYNALVQQKVESERKQHELNAKEEEAHQRQRRADLVSIWTLRSKTLSSHVKSAVTSLDVPETRQCVRNCIVFQDEVREGFKQFPPTCQQTHVDAFEKILATLSAACRVAEQLTDSRNNNGNNVFLSSSLQQGAIPDVPEQLRLHIQQHDAAKVITYVQACQQTMSLATIAEIRTLWAASTKQWLWVQQLHKGIHMAFALRNAQLLQAQIDVAKQHEHVDDVVISAQELVAGMLEEAKKNEPVAAVAAPSSSSLIATAVGTAATAADEKDGAAASSAAGSSAVVQPPPLIDIPQLSFAYNPSQGSRSVAILTLYNALISLMHDKSNTCGKVDSSKVLVAENELTTRSVLNAWIQLLQHRAKPSGIFKKVDRNMIDVLQLVGNMQKNGEYLASYTSALCNDFERMKKFNNPQGNSSSYIMMQYILVRGCLDLILLEFARIGPKDLSDVFFDDSLHRTPSCTPDLKLLAEFSMKIEWPFVIHEKPSVSVDPILRQQPAAIHSTPGSATVSRAGDTFTGSPPSASNGTINSTNGSGTVVALNGGAASQQQALLTAAVASLRRAVAVLSKYFASGLKDLGARPTCETIKLLFDEQTHKAIGLIVRDHLCAAFRALLSGGFKSTHFLMKRHLWDVVTALSERLRESARDLGGVGIPDAVDVVLHLTESSNRNRTVLAGRSDDEVNEIRLRMFFCHLLNQQKLAAFFERLFDDDKSDSLVFLHKYYAKDQCFLLPTSSAAAQEVMKILSMLSELPFVMCLDSEIW